MNLEMIVKFVQMSEASLTHSIALRPGSAEVNLLLIKQLINIIN